MIIRCLQWVRRSTVGIQCTQGTDLALRHFMSATDVKPRSAQSSPQEATEGDVYPRFH